MPDKAYTFPQFAAVMRVLSCNPRGAAAKLKPEGGVFKIQYDPGDILHLMFFRAGQPYAVAVCKEVKKEVGEWCIYYTGVKWLIDQEPDRKESE